MKPRTISHVLAACAIALVASGCSDGGGGGPASSPFQPIGTEPARVTGSEPTTGGDDPLPGQQTSLEALCVAACNNLQGTCPGAPGADCPSSCLSAGSSNQSCLSQFRVFVACLARAPVYCIGTNLSIPACDAAAAAFSSCANGIGP